MTDKWRISELENVCKLVIFGVSLAAGAGSRAARRAMLSNVFSKVKNSTRSGAFSSIFLTFLVPLLGASKISNGSKSRNLYVVFHYKNSNSP